MLVVKTLPLLKEIVDEGSTETFFRIIIRKAIIL